MADIKVSELIPSSPKVAATLAAAIIRNRGYKDAGNAVGAYKEILEALAKANQP